MYCKAVSAPNLPLATRCVESKRIATLVARCALMGVRLDITDADFGKPLYVASKWALTRQMHSVEEVEAFIRRLGGVRV